MNIQSSIWIDEQCSSKSSSNVSASRIRLKCYMMLKAFTWNQFCSMSNFLVPPPAIWLVLTRYSHSTATSGLAFYWTSFGNSMLSDIVHNQRGWSRMLLSFLVFTCLSVFWLSCQTWFTFFSHIKFYFMWTLFNSSRRSPKAAAIKKKGDCGVDCVARGVCAMAVLNWAELSSASARLS